MWPGDEWVLKEAILYYYQTPIYIDNHNSVPKISQIPYHAVYNTETV